MKEFSILLFEENETIMKLLEEINIMDLAIALKHSQQDIRDFIYLNMPNHEISVVEDLIKELDQITESDSEEAQKQILLCLNKVK